MYKLWSILLDFVKLYFGLIPIPTETMRRDGKKIYMHSH